MKSKLGIDFDKVGHAREMARKIADQVQDFVDGYTTVAVERTLCRLLKPISDYNLFKLNFKKEFYSFWVM